MGRSSHLGSQYHLAEQLRNDDVFALHNLLQQAIDDYFFGF